MLLITHDLGVVAQTCDKVAIMYGGHIVESGTVQDIYEAKEHHPYTTGLFRSIPEMNKDSDRLAPIPGLMPDPADLPAGCSFCPRCACTCSRCQSENPDMTEVEPGHFVKCFQIGKEEEHV